MRRVLENASAFAGASAVCSNAEKRLAARASICNTRMTYRYMAAQLYGLAHISHLFGVAFAVQRSGAQLAGR